MRTPGTTELLGRAGRVMATSTPVYQGVLIVIPAFNECSSVASVVSSCQHEVPGATVLVVDDGSSDGTGDVALAAGALVARLPFNLGVGGAMRTGYRFALRHHFTAVVQVDADGQHNPSDIPELLAQLGGKDLVIGARFSGVGHYEVRGPRRLAMQVLARLMTQLLGVPISDATSGFRAAGQRAIKTYAHHYPAEYLGDTLETLVIARKTGLQIGQVPVAMSQRSTGRPSRGPIASTLELGRAVFVVALGLLRDWSVTGDGTA